MFEEDKLDYEPIRNFDDNSKNNTKLIIERELKAFEESNDKDAIITLYKTELKKFYFAWIKHRKDAREYNIDWKYDPMEYVKKNKFYYDVFPNQKQ